MKYSIKLDKRLPFIGHINGANLLEIQRLEISLGGFGRQFRDEHDDVDMRDETGGEEQQLLSFKRDFGDEEKSTMEVALKDGLEKFPDSVVLNEWMEKMNELFKEVQEGASNKKVHEPECCNELNMNDVGVNEEMIKMLDENELQVYRRKKLMSGMSGDNVVGRNIGEVL
ncbi:unnamed protein product [Lactuca virosa]|uniref:Uncharacterized protein n=1 Tax=Lactuca virosa TaxID=75947 RepID=A0AAU9M1X7_9ASTR|nr:unnamed protein product [Lactuca virosa]